MGEAGQSPALSRNGSLIVRKPDYPPSSLLEYHLRGQRGPGMNVDQTCSPLTGGFFILRSGTPFCVSARRNAILISAQAGTPIPFNLISLGGVR